MLSPGGPGNTFPWLSGEKKKNMEEEEIQKSGLRFPIPVWSRLESASVPCESVAEKEERAPFLRLNAAARCRDGTA